MAIASLHRDVAAIALSASASHGFALAGGNALIAHGLISRLTQDIDLFSDVESAVAAAADGVVNALRDAGYTVQPRDNADQLADVFEGMEEGLAEWIVVAPSGDHVLLQMAYFERIREPVRMDVGPVLDLEDVIGGKVCALASRAEPRDYADVAAALERYTIDQLIGFARRMDLGLTNRDFADAGDRLDRWGDRVFGSVGLDPEDVARLRKQFEAWPRS
jgi:Nucleotidyl transferase AbiEii toxin, Type IV TA system